MQRSEPDQAWTWSLEAMLADESDSRARAIAMASYLDPRSAWLQQVPEEERTRAVSQFSRANPFLKGGDQRFRHGI
jgi:hypothetical protein